MRKFTMPTKDELIDLISEYKEKYHEMDKAIAARDKIIDDQREKIEEYREKYYDQLYDNDGLKLDITDIRKELNTALKDKLAVLEQLKDAKKEIKINDEVHSEKIAKFAQNLKLAEENLQITEKKLIVAKNVVKDLKEQIEEKDIQIENMKHSIPVSSKFTTETQTSLHEELKTAKVVDKFSKERSTLTSKLLNLQSKVNEQIVHLSESIQNLNHKTVRCKYGWKCKRKFCKFSHEYLYSYRRLTSSKCDETFENEVNVGTHKEYRHEKIQETIELPLQAASENLKKNIEGNVQEQPHQSSPSSSLSTSSSSITSSLTSVSSQDSVSLIYTSSVNSSEREEVGGMS